MARATRAQSPRVTTAILPATPAATYSAGSQPSEIPPALFLRTTIGSEPLGRAAPLALIASRVVPVFSVMRAPGKLAVGSFAATLIVRVPDAGVPVMYGTGPSLPADETTMTPSLDALSAATADGSSSVP